MTILFMYIGIAVALIVAVVSSFFTAFNIIDYVLVSEDPHDWYWYHRYVFDALSGSVSFLLVSYGILVYISRKVRLLTDNRFHTTVFYRICHAIVLLLIILSFFAVAISLATLLAGFLGGDISLGYAFKALFVAGVGGVVFFYYRGVLQGMWRTHRKEERILVGTCTVLVLFLITVGIIILNPLERRSINETFETLEIIDAFSEDINAYYKRVEDVPDLDTVNSGAFLDNEGVYREYSWGRHLGERFTYERLDKSSYRICASFESVPNEAAKKSNGYPYRRFEVEEEGEQCFTLNAEEGYSQKDSAR